MSLSPSSSDGPRGRGALRAARRLGDRPLASGWTAVCQLAGLGALALGCSVAPADDAEAEKGSTHAVVAVSRQDPLNASPRGDALAGFVQLPASTDRDSALELAGLGVAVPEVGQCWRKNPERSTGAASSVSRIELLDAGRVRLVAGSAEPHDLAPHAFPTIADFISGVLYASRDRSGEGLPPGQLYRIETSSDGIVGALSASHEAPSLPADVTLNGSAFESAESLSSGAPLDLTWRVSNDATDRLYVELAREDSASVVCSFEDTSGAGTVPTDGYAEGDSARLAVHRLRLVRTVPSTQGSGSPGGQDETVDQLELRFDFSVSRSVRFESARFE